MSRAVINSLCGQLATHRIRFGLRRGATSRQLESFRQRLAATNLKPPADLLTFYSHFNGCSQSIDGYYRLLTLSEALVTKRGLDRLEREGHFSDWRPGTWWNLNWFPFAAFEGDYLCLDLTGTLAKPAGQVIEVQASQPERPLLYRSFGDWLVALVTIIAIAPTDDARYPDFFSSRQATKVRRQLDPRYPIKRAAVPQRVRPAAAGTQLRSFQRGAYAWRIELRGTAVVIHYGRGYSRLERTKRFANRQLANAYMQQAIQEKLASGYRPVSNASYQ